MTTKRTIGGISLATKWKAATKQEVLDYFLQNSDFKILTDTSVSCITYVATLRADKESPFFSIRSQTFQQPVRSMLMKVCIHTLEKQFIQDFRNLNNNKAMETMSKEDITKEVKIQDDLFRKSYVENVAEPVCPSILYVQENLPKQLQEMYYRWIDKNLVERNSTMNPNKDHHITQFLFYSYNLCIIFMEFAEGYLTLFDLWNELYTKPQGMLHLNRYLTITIYELYRLYHIYGIVHGDIHFGNILIKPDYSYIGKDKPGKILLIDFGKSFYETPDKYKGVYDTLIYHQNTKDFVNLLSTIENKNDVLQHIYNDLDQSRKINKQLFLDSLFNGSLTKWSDWSDHNIHYPFNSSQSFLTPKKLPRNFRLWQCRDSLPKI